MHLRMWQKVMPSSSSSSLFVSHELYDEYTDSSSSALSSPLSELFEDTACALGLFDLDTIDG